MNLFFKEDTLFDSHAHLISSQFEIDVAQVVNAAVEAGVERIIDVGIDLKTSENAINNAKQHAGRIYAAAGIDPQVLIPSDKYYKSEFLDLDYLDEQMEVLEELISANLDQVVAIGETGIDDYYTQAQLTSGQISSQERDNSLAGQEQMFRSHLQLATKYDLPVTVHSRNAEPKCAEIVAEFKDARGVFHSFAGSYETAKRILDLGWGLGVNGIITFKNATALREVYSKILGKVSPDWSPADFYNKAIYFETDSPYLAPGSRRGEQNQPAYLSEIYDYMVSDFANQIS